MAGLQQVALLRVSAAQKRPPAQAKADQGAQGGTRLVGRAPVGRTGCPTPSGTGRHCSRWRAPAGLCRHQRHRSRRAGAAAPAGSHCRKTQTKGAVRCERSARPRKRAKADVAWSNRSGWDGGTRAAGAASGAEEHQWPPTCSPRCAGGPLLRALDAQKELRRLRTVSGCQFRKLCGSICAAWPAARSINRSMYLWPLVGELASLESFSP